MTTVVYFKGVIAADRFVSGPTSVYTDKVLGCTEGYVGICGDLRILPKLALWLDEHDPTSDPCVTEAGVSFLDDGESASLLVRPDGTAWILYPEGIYWTKVDTYAPVAIGSGAQFAIGAAWTHTGPAECCAEMGVRVAAIFDPGTKVDGGVQIIELPKPEKARALH